MKKLLVFALTAVVGLVGFAADIAVDDGGTASIDLQGSNNAAGNRIVFAGSGTLTLTNPGAGEVAFLPQIIAAEEGAEIVVDANACAGHELRLKNHVSAKGSLGITGPTVVKFGDTAVTPGTLDAATAVVAAFPMLDVAALADGTSITIDGAAQITKAQTGFTYGDNAFVALSGEKVFGDATEVDLDFNAVLVNTAAFKSGATAKVAAGKTFGYYPATVNDDFTWTELSGEVTVGLSVALGGDSKDESAEYHLWATAATTSHTFNGAITGYGNVNVRPMRSNSPTITYYFCGRNTCVGTFTSTKVTNVSFNMGVPEGGVVGFEFDLNHINSIYFYSGTSYGATTVTVPKMKAGYINTTLGVKGGQTVVLKELASGTGGLQVLGDNGKGSKFILEKNSAPTVCLRMQYVDYTLDDTTWAKNEYLVYDTSYTRVHFFNYNSTGRTPPTTATKNNLLYGSASGAPYDVDVLTEGSFQNAEDKFRFHVFENARFSLNNAGANLVVDAANGVTATITGEIGTGAKITAKAGSTVTIDATFADAPTISAEQGATVVLTEKAKDLAVASTGATVEYQGTEGWQDMVALWVDASKPETLKPLTNATGAVVYQDRGTDCGMTNCVARAWWYDWRETQTTYYLYNDRSYSKNGFPYPTYDNVNYVNPWWQPTGGPNNGPCVIFGPVKGTATGSSTPARLDVHRFADASDVESTITARYVLMVYGASSHQAMRGGSALYYNGVYNIQRSVDESSGDLTDPVLNAKGTTDYDVRMDGADATKGSTTYFKDGGGWQIIGIDVPNNTGNFSGLGRRTNYIGGGQMYAEVLVFSERPTDRQIAAAEKYLAEKWGLALAKETPDIAVTPKVTGSGTIRAGEHVALTLENGFRGTVETVEGMSLALPTGRAIPNVADIPTDGQLGWYDPSVADSVVLTAISAERVAQLAPFHAEQTNDICFVRDRVVARRSVTGAVALAAEAGRGPVFPGCVRRPHLTNVAYGLGDPMNWMDCNDFYLEYDVSGGVTNQVAHGNAFRFWRDSLLMAGSSDSDQAVPMTTAFIVQNSVRGGGTPIADKFGLWNPTPYGRVTGSPSAALWKWNASGQYVAAVLTNGTVAVNGKKVADPFKSAEFTGGPEVVTFRTKGGAFDLKAVGDFYNSEGTAQTGEIFGEMLFYGSDAALTDADCADIEAYLSWKWFGGVQEGYRQPKAFSISGGAAITVATTADLPLFADGYEGLVKVTSADGLAFTVAASSPTATAGYFDLKGGTLDMAEASVRVAVDGRIRHGSYKLIGWNAMPETTFTLAEAATGSKPAALRKAEDGLYLDVTKLGLMLFIRGDAE